MVTATATRLAVKRGIDSTTLRNKKNGSIGGPETIYTAPLGRTMAGYKLLCGTFMLSSSIAAPSLLLNDGSESGIVGACAIMFAGLLPFVIQMRFVPRYVASVAVDVEAATQMGMSTDRPGRALRGADILDRLSNDTPLQLVYFSAVGKKRTLLARVGELATVRHPISWATLQDHSGKEYSLQRKVAGPSMNKILDFLDTQPSKRIP
ncbi:hypothetical protein PYCC9005_002408 [Savitreella phatthalungensis]